jgi:hypothetical protein
MGNGLSARLRVRVRHWSKTQLSLHFSFFASSAGVSQSFGSVTGGGAGAGSLGMSGNLVFPLLRLNLLRPEVCELVRFGIEYYRDAFRPHPVAPQFVRGRVPWVGRDVVSEARFPIEGIAGSEHLD